MKYTVKKLILGLFLLSPFLTITLMSKNNFAQAQSEFALSYGKAVEGIQLSIKTDKRVLSMAQPLVTTVTIRNAADVPISFVETTPEGDFEFLVKNAKGKIMPLTRFGKTRENMATFGRVIISLKPGETKQYQVPVSKLYEMTKPGAYMVSARRTVMKRKGSGFVWVKSNFLKISVK